MSIPCESCRDENTHLYDCALCGKAFCEECLSITKIYVSFESPDKWPIHINVCIQCLANKIDTTWSLIEAYIKRC